MRPTEVARHALAILVLPVTVTIAIPAWIWRTSGITPGLPDSTWGWTSMLGGVPLLVGGAVLFLASLVRFDREGRGTLAPWDPPRALVTRGPYAYVRNPMISGVCCILLAEALLLRSVSHLTWATGFILFNAIFIPIIEEPGMRRRFGADYVTYTRHVPRLVPRLLPWRNSGGDRGAT